MNTKLAQFEETRDHLNSRKAEVDNVCLLLTNFFCVAIEVNQCENGLFVNV